MERKVILKTAIEKAVENKWMEVDWIMVNDILDIQIMQKGTGHHLSFVWQEILFDHLFCRAFAKYLYESNNYMKLTNRDFGGNQKGIENQIEKQFKIELVLSEDRLEYLKKFL